MAPIQDIVASGAYKDWQLLKRVMPVDQRADYNYIAIDFIEDINTFVGLDYSAVAKKALSWCRHSKILVYCDQLA